MPYLKVDDLHTIFYLETGNPQGIPITVLHGGPGSGLSLSLLNELFDPEKFRVIAFDQRGCGKSRPLAEVKQNTTQLILKDINLLLDLLKLDSSYFFGGSWGSTLALAYANSFPERVLGLVLYGIFLGTNRELQELYYPGGLASKLFSDVFDKFLSVLEHQQQSDPIQGYNSIFLDQSPSNKDKRTEAIKVWTWFEKRMSKLLSEEEEKAVDKDFLCPVTEPTEFTLSHSTLECHYFLNNCFIDGDVLVTNLIGKLEGKPVHIVQGRYDIICPFRSAWHLHTHVAGSKLHIMPRAGHSWTECSTRKKLKRVLDLL